MSQERTSRRASTAGLPPRWLGRRRFALRGGLRLEPKVLERLVEESEHVRDMQSDGRREAKAIGRTETSNGSAITVTAALCGTSHTGAVDDIDPHSRRLRSLSARGDCTAERAILRASEGLGSLMALEQAYDDGCGAHS